MNIDELNVEIEKFIQNEVEYIQNYIKNKDKIQIQSQLFSKGYTFYGKDYQSNKGYPQVRGLNGIYVIYMDEDLFLDEKTVFDFNESGKGGKFKKYKDYNLKKGDCIYVGSCTSESLFSRLNQHFKNSDCYGSLQLGDKNRKILKDKIKIVAFPLRFTVLDCNNVFLKCIERKLHDILNHTNGSPRV